MKQESVRLKNNRKLRVRKSLRGRPGRPRLSVHKSNKHLAAQIIDDIQGKTVVGLATSSKEFRGTDHGRISKAAATELGRKLAELALAKDISQVVLDRGPFKYHGVIAALASAAREAGLKF